MTPSNSHVVERAVRIGESQQPWRRGKWASAASGQLPLLLLPKEKEKRERARSFPEFVDTKNFHGDSTPFYVLNENHIKLNIAHATHPFV